MNSLPKPFYQSERATIYCGDSAKLLMLLESKSIDSIVTDPPYGIRFMCKKWDYAIPSKDIWSECFRILKSSGNLISFASTRTQHRMASRIEDSGFEIRDMLAWVYGSGYPKSSTLLKPAFEPITVARKSSAGALNIDPCRIMHGEPMRFANRKAPRFSGRCMAGGIRGGKQSNEVGPNRSGRWPANFIHDGSAEVLKLFPITKGSHLRIEKIGDSVISKHDGLGLAGGRPIGFKTPGYADAGSAARYFYCAKASRSDRGIKNNHPTVKPINLMRWLVRLSTHQCGIVLDPFMGSGSTGLGALREGRRFVGIEIDPDYCAIAAERIAKEEKSTQ